MATLQSPSGPQSAGQPGRTDFHATTSDGLQISCLLETKLPSSQDVVVVAHGGLDNKRSPVIRGLAERLPHNIVTFDFRGMGESDGDTNMSNYDDEMKDLHAVCEHVCGPLGMKIIAIVAHSKSTVSTLHYAAHHHPCRSPLLILCNPPFDHARAPIDPAAARAFRQVMTTGKPSVRGTYRNKGQVRELLVTREGIEKRSKVDVRELARKVERGVEVRVLTGERDDVIPVEDSLRYEQAFADRGVKVALLRECGHYYRTPREQAALAAEVGKYIAERGTRVAVAAPAAGKASKPGRFKLKL